MTLYELSEEWLRECKLRGWEPVCADEQLARMCERSDPLTLEDESIFADSIEYIEGFIARWDRLN